MNTCYLQLHPKAVQLFHYRLEFPEAACRFLPYLLSFLTYRSSIGDICIVSGV